MSAYTKDTLVQQTTAEYLEQQLGWQSVYACNNEDFGPDNLLRRISDREVVLTRTLREELVVLNLGLGWRFLITKSAGNSRRLFQKERPDVKAKSAGGGTGLFDGLLNPALRNQPANHDYFVR